MTRPTMLLMLPLAFAVGCGGNDVGTTEGANGVKVAAGPSEDSAEATVRYIMDGVKDGQPIVAWNALPRASKSLKI